jgi:hypothetical protein
MDNVEKTVEHFSRYECGKVGTVSEWHQWSCIAYDRSFAVHIWAAMRHGGDWSGGVESHTPPKEGEEPTHEMCPLLMGPCLHDGSSTYFRESFRGRAAEAIRNGDVAGMLRAAEGVFFERLRDRE